ncbi:MAG: sugar ABC transporter permease, partial [Gemmatimonadetes bacterium]|nr:sugar ABC transporter permease [Gemmatimonadota bacterium]
MGVRGFQLSAVGVAVLLGALVVGWHARRDRRALLEARQRVALEAATALRAAVARGEEEAAAARFEASRGYRLRVLSGAALPAALLDSLRRDEAPRPSRDGVLAPLKDVDDWDVVGAVEAAPLPGTEARPTLLRAGVALPLAALALAALWLGGWAARTPERRRRETVAAWSFLAAPFAHLAVFSLAPVAFTLYLAFHHWDLLAPAKPFVGLANFRELGRDPLFWTALRNTALYVLYVPITMAAALGAALLLDRRRGGERLVRAVVFLPYVTSTVAIAIVWQWIFNHDFGLLNYLSSLLGLPPVDWLGRPASALAALVCVTVWTQVGYQMVIFLAGLQGIPRSYYDAALVDGATAWQRFRAVTLPLLRPVVLFVLVTGIIAGFQVFTLVYMMTEGGPLHSTDVLVYRIYQTAWEFLRFGYASAMAIVL